MNKISNNKRFPQTKTDDYIKNDNKGPIKKSTFTSAALSGAANDTVQRYGSAVKEHLISYGGVDYETGKTLTKSLKSISNSKVHPDYRNTNINQQAGFSAEVKETARENAERIIHRDRTKVSRTDDFGSINDQLNDHVVLNKDGNPIKGTYSQMKFVGKDSKALLNKLVSRKYEKYFNDGCKIEIPSDCYEDVKDLIQEKINSLEKQVEATEAKGEFGLAQQKRAQIDKYKTVDKNLEKSHVSKSEAKEARLAPKLSTTKDVIRLSHRAGTESAKYGALIGGGISGIRNAVAIVKGEKKAEEAAEDVVIDTAKAALTSYSTAFVGTALKGTMQNAPTEFIRNLSKTNLPATVVTTALETTKTLVRYFNGEIDGGECLTELGDKGTGMLSSAMFATAGQILIPIPVVGGLVGGMVGYAFSSAYYNQLVTAMKEAKIAREERTSIEAECEDAICAIREYRLEINRIISEYLSEYKTVFDSAFEGIKASLEIYDVDGCISNINSITRELGGTTRYETLDEFNTLMTSPEPFKL